MITVNPFAVGQKLRAGDTVLSGWASVPDPVLVETIASAGFEAVVLDGQHGSFSLETVSAGITAAAAARAGAFVRVPVGGAGFASQALDLGAAGIIYPMVNTVADARALVEAVKYPPLGGRSWGPGRAVAFSGLDATSYLHRANDLTLSLAMIETAEAIEHLEAILAVPGIDGVFVGPNDLSVSLTRGRHVDPTHRDVVSALETVLIRTRRASKFAGIFANTPELGREYVSRGFKLVNLGYDMGHLRNAVSATLAQVKGG